MTTCYILLTCVNIRICYRVTDEVDAVNTCCRHCGIENPSWSELKHFVNFLNVQLSACEISVFCSEMLAPDLPGFINFVIQFMIQMSKVRSSISRDLTACMLKRVTLVTSYCWPFMLNEFTKCSVRAEMWTAWCQNHEATEPETHFWMWALFWLRCCALKTCKCCYWCMTWPWTSA